MHDAQTFVNTIRVALDSVNPQVPFVDSSPSNQIEASDPYTKRCAHDAHKTHTPYPSISIVLGSVYLA